MLAVRCCLPVIVKTEVHLSRLTIIIQKTGWLSLGDDDGQMTGSLSSGDDDGQSAQMSFNLNLTFARCPHGIRPPENKNSNEL
jgi:hypothetical protein